MGAVYGPGLLPLITHSQPLDEHQQIDALFEFASLDLLPLFHEVVGDTVYRVLSHRGERKIAPIPDKINQRVLSDVSRLTLAIDPQLMDWLEVPLLLLPGGRGRGQQVLALPGHPLNGLQVRNLGGDRNTLSWLHSEAQENANAPQPKGYTASLGARFGFEPIIQAYGQLLDCFDYCDRFKFVFRLSAQATADCP